MKRISLRHLSLCALLPLLTQGLEAQRKSQEELKASYEEMLHSDWFTGGGWTADFAAAKAEAKKTGKPIFAYFTRTYAP